MYPPRYFVGWIILENRNGNVSRITFENALLIPVTMRRAYIFAGNWTAAYYGEAIRQSTLGGRVQEIQYAISALNARTLRPEIEKFKHPFARPPSFYRDNDHFVITMPARTREPLFISEPLHNVLDRAQGSRVPVVQFIA